MPSCTPCSMTSRRPELVSKATRRALHSLATEIYVKAIEGLWQDQGFVPVSEHHYEDSSVRRTTFESYAAAVDWTDVAHVERALRVFEAQLRWLARQQWHRANSLPSMLGWFTTPCSTSRPHTTALVRVAVEDCVVGPGEGACSTVSGKSLARQSRHPTVAAELHPRAQAKMAKIDAKIDPYRLAAPSFVARVGAGCLVGRRDAGIPGRLATRSRRPRVRSNPHSQPRRRASPHPLGAAAGWPADHVPSCTQGSDDSALRETGSPVVQPI